MEFGENKAVIDVRGLGFEVLLSRPVLEDLKTRPADEEVTLVVYFYLQAGPSRIVPVVIGFNSEMERDFFEQFITVASIGPKSAVKSLIYPFGDIAKAIDTGDERLLKSMPGIGARKVKEIIAKLQGKLSKFFVLSEGEKEEFKYKPVFIPSDIKDEALEVLLQLQLNKNEALKKIEKALQRKPDIKDSGELVNFVLRENI